MQKDYKLHKLTQPLEGIGDALAPLFICSYIVCYIML